MKSLMCNICNSPSVENYLKKDQWEILRCFNCGLAFVKDLPREEDLKKIYSTNYFRDGQKSTTGDFKLDHNPAHMNAQRRLKKIRKLGPMKGRLLDIGSATGFFLKAASSFYECLGLDISKQAIDFAVNKLGVKAICGNLFEVNFEQGYFDVVTMWDVIEHTTNPDKYIKRVSQLVRPGGLLALTTGDMQSLMFKVQKNRWHLLTPPQHLYYFNQKAISILLGNHGFNPISITHDGQYTNVGYIINKLRRIHTKNKLVSFMDFVIKTLNLNRLNIYLNLYDVMTVYARR